MNKLVINAKIENFTILKGGSGRNRQISLFNTERLGKKVNSLAERTLSFFVYRYFTFLHMTGISLLY